MKKAVAKGVTGEERRKARLAEALRNNLAQRKARSSKSSDLPTNRENCLPEITDGESAAGSGVDHACPAQLMSSKGH